MDLNTLSPKLKTLYRTIQETQTSIHSEIIMAREIGQYSSKAINEKMYDKFIKQIIKYKQHYAMISMIYLLKRSEKKCLPFKNVKSFFSSNFKIEQKNVEDEWKSENLIPTLQFLNGKEQESEDLINLLTFSLIPSLFINFLEVNTFNSFVEFINLLPETLQPSFSRTLFVSPFFLKFINLIFYYNLKPFYEGRYSALSDHNNNFLNDLQGQILASVRSNIHFLPSFFPQFLNAFKDLNKREIIIKKAFIEPLIENPAMYGVVDSYIFENDDQFQKITKILKGVLNDEFVHEFNQIIEKSDFFYNSFLNQQAVDNYHSSLKRCQIISNIDQIIMKQINTINTRSEGDYRYDIYKIINEEQIESYSLFRCIFSDESEENEKIFLETFRVKDDGWSYLKEMIKKSPPLPPIESENETEKVDSKVPKKEFLNLIKSTIVDKYDPLSSISDELSFKMIQNNISINHKGYMSNFEQMKTKHTEVEDALNASQILMNEISDISEKTKGNLKLTLEFFISYMTKNIESKETSKSISILKIVKDPIKTVNDLISYIKESEALMIPIIGDVDCRVILARRFYSAFHFHNFLAIRSDLTKYDNIVENFLSNKFYVFRKEMENKQGLKEKIKFTMLYDIKKFDYYSNKLIIIFESNNDPISKMMYISKIMEELLSYFSNSGSQFGEEEKRNITKFFFAYTNPPHLISNLVFLYEFCNYQEEKGELSEISQLCSCYVDRISVLLNYLDCVLLNLGDLPRTDYYRELQLKQRQKRQQMKQENPQITEVPWYQRLKKKIFKK